MNNKEDILARSHELASSINLFIEDYLRYVFSHKTEEDEANWLTPVELKTILDYSAAKLTMDTIVETIMDIKDEKAAATLTTLVFLKAAQSQLERTEQPKAAPLGEVQ